MKLGFWTLGMPAWSNEEIAARASQLGYHGADLRCTRPDEHGQQADAGNLSVAATDAELDAIRAAFDRNGVEISSLLCYRPGGHSDTSTDWEALEVDLAAHARVAERLGAPRIRVTVGAPAPGVSWAGHLGSLWQAAQGAIAATPGTGVVFENHPGSADAGQLLAMAERAGDPRVGVEFSPDHALVMQEDNLGLIDRYHPWIHQVCFADRRVVREDLARFDGRYYYVRYETCWNGDGMVPAAAVFARLADKGYAGYVSLKWEKSDRFGFELAPGDEALAHFPGFMRQFGVIEPAQPGKITQP